AGRLLDRRHLLGSELEDATLRLATRERARQRLLLRHSRRRGGSRAGEDGEDGEEQEKGAEDADLRWRSSPGPHVVAPGRGASAITSLTRSASGMPCL